MSSTSAPAEPDFPTPDNIKKAAEIDAINKNFTQYILRQAALRS